jgi:hypothetical protein
MNTPQNMKFARFLSLIAILMALLGGVETSSSKNAVASGPMAIATVSHRVSRPGQHLELLITVRNAEPPVSALPQSSAGLRITSFRKPQHLTAGDGDVWLLRFGMIAQTVGSYEIPPIRVTTGSGFAMTKPIILHVTCDSKPPMPDARELALTTDIPLELAQEAVKTCPTPAPKPKPNDPPKDGRPYPARLLSSIGNGFRWFWNYPGK